MSYLGSVEDVKKTIHSIEISNDIGHSKGGKSSPVRDGGSASGEVMVPRRTKIKTRTDTLTRKYAAS